MEQIQAEITTEEFNRLRAIVQSWAGIALGDSKRHLVQSRLQKRLRALHLTTFKEYTDFLIAEGDGSPESVSFINCITTNKTDFFREPHHFDFISGKFAEDLTRAYHAGRTRELKIWHAGCSTGEEPYTMAMVLLEAFAHLPALRFKLLATDIDTNVLAHAERGVYELERVSTVPKPLLKKYFMLGRGGQEGFARVRPELQELITFRQLNLLEEPWPFRADTQFDIIFCRNVVIYFDRPTQKRLFERYAEILKPGGHLFVGHSENLIGVTDKFSILGGTIHRRLADAA